MSTITQWLQLLGHSPKNQRLDSLQSALDGLWREYTGWKRSERGEAAPRRSLSIALDCFPWLELQSAAVKHRSLAEPAMAFEEAGDLLAQYLDEDGESGLANFEEAHLVLMQRVYALQQGESRWLRWPGYAVIVITGLSATYLLLDRYNTGLYQSPVEMLYPADAYRSVEAADSQHLTLSDDYRDALHNSFAAHYFKDEKRPAGHDTFAELYFTSRQGERDEGVDDGIGDGVHRLVFKLPLKNSSGSEPLLISHLQARLTRLTDPPFPWADVNIDPKLEVETSEDLALIRNVGAAPALRVNARLESPGGGVLADKSRAALWTASSQFADSENNSFSLYPDDRFWPRLRLQPDDETLIQPLLHELSKEAARRPLYDPAMDPSADSIVDCGTTMFGLEATYRKSQIGIKPWHRSAYRRSQIEIEPWRPSAEKIIYRDPSKPWNKLPEELALLLPAESVSWFAANGERQLALATYLLCRGRALRVSLLLTKADLIAATRVEVAEELVITYEYEDVRGDSHSGEQPWRLEQSASWYNKTRNILPLDYFLLEDESNRVTSPGSGGPDTGKLIQRLTSLLLPAALLSGSVGKSSIRGEDLIRIAFDFEQSLAGLKLGRPLSRTLNTNRILNPSGWLIIELTLNDPPHGKLAFELLANGEQVHHFSFDALRPTVFRHTSLTCTEKLFYPQAAYEEKFGPHRGSDCY